MAREEHADLVRCDYSLNESGGERCVFGGKVFYLCGVGEKMSSAFRVHVRGRSGHASVPSIADNALVKATRYIEALGRYEPPKQLLPEVRRFLEVVLGEVPPLEDALARARALHPLAAELVEPLLSLTLSPTMIEASRQRNVIPGALHDHGRLPACCRDRRRRRRSRCCVPCWGRRLGARVDSRGSRRRHRRRRSDTPLWRALEDVGGAARAGRHGSRR